MPYCAFSALAIIISGLKLSNSVSYKPWLVGDALSIADIAIAALLSLLRFPFSSGESLFGKRQNYEK